MQTRASLILALTLLAMISCLLGTVIMPQQTLGRETDRATKRTQPVKVDKGAELVPVEEDMHEFMEYVFQPTYRRLKVSMSKTPASNADWKAIKADSLSLAEAANLIIMRPPSEDVEDWNHHSVEVRNHGKAFYSAARSKDFAAATKHYQAMLKSCNACHQQFEDGRHILTP